MSERLNKKEKETETDTRVEACSFESVSMVVRSNAAPEATPPEKALEKAPEANPPNVEPNVEHWVQCDNCDSWRVIDSASAESLTEGADWFCYMHKTRRFLCLKNNMVTRSTRSTRKKE